VIILNVLLYARVSTDSQAQFGHSLDAQIQELRDYAQKFNWTIVGEFVDRGLSGRSDDRDAFLAMINLATAPKSGIGAILVHKFDRFSRNREDAITYKALLKKHDVLVISISEPVEDSPAGLLVEGILETIAEFYSRNLAEEVKKGQLQAAKKGLNQSEAPLGYRSQNGLLTIEEKEALIVQYIFTRYKEGESYRRIAKEVQAFFDKKIHSSTVSYILRNQVYIGNRLWNQRNKDGSIRDKSQWIVAENSHEPIISETLFYEVQRLLEQNKRSLKTHLFSGLCQCGYCQSTLHCHKQRNQVRLRCPQKNKGCIGVSILEGKVETVVLESIRELLYHATAHNHLVANNLESLEIKRLLFLAAIDTIKISTDHIEVIYLNC
jgi:site-specific DNA recombinase